MVTLAWPPTSGGPTATPSWSGGRVPALGLELHLRLDGFADHGALAPVGVRVRLFAGLTRHATPAPGVRACWACSPGRDARLSLADDLLLPYALGADVGHVVPADRRQHRRRARAAALV